MTKLYDGRGYFIDKDANAFRFTGEGLLPVSPDDEAFFSALRYSDGPVFNPWTYELIGPDVKNNPEQVTVNHLVPHGRLVILVAPFYQSIKQYLAGRNMAGLVIWEDIWDIYCRKAKVRQEDFGFRRNRNRKAE